MIQRLFALLCLQWILCSGTALAAPAAQNEPSVESRFHDGITCLQKTNIECAKMALNAIPRQSLYAKLLAGNIAAAEKDFDTTFQLLLPLKANATLSDDAAASLHASLALAYDNQPDTLRALEHRTAAERFLSTPPAIQQNHEHIWHSLSQIASSDLVEMRGESMNTDIQGWIDLALAAKEQDPAAINNWKQFYPGHPASFGFSEQLLADRPAPQAATAAAPLVPNSADKIGLILPFAIEMYYPAADAIEQGFAAAQQQAGDHRELKLYATTGDKDAIVSIYQQAVSDGVKIALGPLTRDEVTTLSQQAALPLPTLALNLPADNSPHPASLHIYGLPLEAEVAQIVRIAQRLGMQTATVVAGGNGIATRMAQAFTEEWTAAGGQITLQLAAAESSSPTELQTQINANPADMIFIAANAEEARILRPYLDNATPTFGVSHLYAGIPQDSSDDVLSAVRFIDMPWLLKPDAAEFSAYKAAAADLPPGEMQRWFALGVDAYKILDRLAQHPGQPFGFQGLTGKINISNTGEISRELTSARFSNQGVVVENTP
ncbi:penicillin-binding protein activator [Methylobacillus gramineus]|uniref:penicillin-binding protein activator n=1 Tax=Methylobacillus gramineus TaxID=755169 RepID=UPI001CFFCCE1|nr:penicillin-binding protein activator [Methylobacillus gramineus]MCB5186192.1 penicillin-binding protein activator [Methylobacillus gramineus]